jgi:hypothetical protein
MKHKLATLSKSDFIEVMSKSSHCSLSYNGLEILYNYLTAIQKDLGQAIEFHPVVLSCDFIERTVYDIIELNDITLDVDSTDEETLEIALNQLAKFTIILGVTDKGTIVYKDY